MRLLSLLLAGLLAIGGLFAAIAAGSSLLGGFSMLSDSQQRLVSGALLCLTAVNLAIGGVLKRRRAAREDGDA